MCQFSTLNSYCKHLGGSQFLLTLHSLQPSGCRAKLMTIRCVEICGSKLAAAYSAIAA